MTYTFFLDKGTLNMFIIIWKYFLPYKKPLQFEFKLTNRGEYPIHWTDLFNSRTIVIEINLTSWWNVDWYLRMRYEDIVDHLRISRIFSTFCHQPIIHLSVYNIHRLLFRLLTIAIPYFETTKNFTPTEMSVVRIVKAIWC